MRIPSSTHTIFNSTLSNIFGKKRIKPKDHDPDRNKKDSDPHENETDPQDCADMCPNM